MDEFVEREGVGVVLRSFDETAYQEAAASALALAKDENFSRRAQDVARRHFDLEMVGGRSYVDLYRRLVD